VKHYDWGGTSFIPSLLDITNADARPFAEYWMGTHPLANCIIESVHGEIKLNDYLAENAPLLGTDVQKTFGRLPYLLKVLDVKDMLSIQVHPSKTAAEQEFARENAEGIPLDSPQRNYKDDNHKPELMLALSDFWLLHGFKPGEELVATLNAVPELNELLILYQQSGYEGLYQMVMEMPQEDVNRILQPLIDRIVPLYYENSLDKNDENFWAARAFLTFNSQQPTNNPQPVNIDRGIFSTYLFNLLQLKKGEAVFQAAGVPHAYLEGQNVEIMANSDNVLRGGLTNKHIDVKELLKNVICEPTIFEILKGKELSDGEEVFETAAPDFQLSLFKLQTGSVVSFVPATAEIVLVIEGTAKLENGLASITLERGNPSAIVFPDQTVHLHAVTNVNVYRASVPGLHS
ncbi:MAG: mannose-6-phosphate isomerase, class I, partial [Bacteroidia bacterium]|nr:mannose-6-phosphate isomerase, class I [Bacteroidia bacterium]